MLNSITPSFGARINVAENVWITNPVRNLVNHVKTADDDVEVNLSMYSKGIKMEIKGEKKDKELKFFPYKTMRKDAPNLTEIKLITAYNKGVSKLTGKNNTK